METSVQESPRREKCTAYFAMQLRFHLLDLWLIPRRCNIDYNERILGIKVDVCCFAASPPVGRGSGRATMGGGSVTSPSTTATSSVSGQLELFRVFTAGFWHVTSVVPVLAVVSANPSDAHITTFSADCKHQSQLVRESDFDIASVVTLVASATHSARYFHQFQHDSCNRSDHLHKLDYP